MYQQRPGALGGHC